MCLHKGFQKAEAGEVRFSFQDKEPVSHSVPAPPGRPRWQALFPFMLCIGCMFFTCHKGGSGISNLQERLLVILCAISLLRFFFGASSSFTDELAETWKCDVFSLLAGSGTVAPHFRITQKAGDAYGREQSCVKVM